MELNILKIKDYLCEKELQYKYCGKTDIIIEGFCSLSNLKNNHITWIKKNPENTLKQLECVENLTVVCEEFGEYEKYAQYNYIFCNNPKEIFFVILKNFFGNVEDSGISKKSVIETDKIGKNCVIGNNCYIGPQVVLEDNVQVGHNVVIQNKVYIKKNTIIGSGTVIGSEGFGYYKNSEGISEKVPHFGGVQIGECVEIGANTCIDRGTLDDTVIGDYVKIDNLCHIAHNVQIGDKSKVIALSLLAGSCNLGESVYVAPGTLVKNQVKIGNESIVGLGAMVLKDVEDRKVVVGAPAKVLRDVTEEDLKL